MSIPDGLSAWCSRPIPSSTRPTFRWTTAVPRELPPGGEDQYLRHKKLRASTPTGPYYVGSILDVTERVPEASETNNVLRFPATSFSPQRSRLPRGVIDAEPASCGADPTQTLDTVQRAEQ